MKLIKKLLKIRNKEIHIILKICMFVNFNNCSIKKYKKIEICNFVIIVRELEVKSHSDTMDVIFPYFWFFDVFLLYDRFFSG
jgi:hypothetical protein